MAQTVKNLTAMWVSSLDRESPSCFLAWEIPRTEKSGGLYSPWGHKESGMTELPILSLSPYAEVILTSAL